MTATGNPPGPRGDTDLQPAEGMLVRVRVASPTMRGLPPAPPGADVSASFSSAAAARAAPDLAASGYRVLGVSRGAIGSEAYADFLVAQDVIEGHPDWWRALAGQADATFNLAAGPVRVAFADVLRAHRPRWR